MLITKRCVLSNFANEDLEDLYAMTSDFETMKYTGFKRVLSLSEVKDKLRVWKQDNGIWCCREKTDKSFIGWFMLKPVKPKTVEIGFMLSKSKWRKGYGLEVSQFLIKYLKNKDSDMIFMATTQFANKASQELLKKLGFQLDRVDEELIYYLLR